MGKNFQLTVGVLMVLVVSSSAWARRDQVREHSQQARIHRGVKDGSLTKGEAHRLRAEQRSLDRQQERAEKDGVITDKEAARLERHQDRMNKEIYKQRHDEQVAEPKPGRE